MSRLLQGTKDGEDTHRNYQRYIMCMDGRPHLHGSTEEAGVTAPVYLGGVPPSILLP